MTRSGRIDRSDTRSTLTDGGIDASSLGIISLMVLTTLFHADEILPTADLEPSKPTDLRKNEREMASLLINTLSGPFEPDRYPDQYRQRLNALIEGRAASARPAGIEVPTGTGVQDLMSALRASVEQARLASKSRGKTAARRKRKSA